MKSAAQPGGPLPHESNKIEQGQASQQDTRTGARPLLWRRDLGPGQKHLHGDVMTSGRSKERSNHDRGMQIQVQGRGRRFQSTHKECERRPKKTGEAEALEGDRVNSWNLGIRLSSFFASQPPRDAFLPPHAPATVCCAAQATATAPRNGALRLLKPASK